MSIIISRLKRVLPILVIPFFFYAKCNKDGSKPCNNAPYSFQVTSEFSPQREIYTVGDTIYLTSIFPKKLQNVITNQDINYSNSLGIGGNFNFTKLDSINKTVTDALSDFSVNVTKGQIAFINNPSNLKLSITFLENSDNYELKASVKLLSKGVFYFVVTDLGSQGIRGQNCTNAGFNMTVINANKNLHLFQNALGYSPDAILAKNIYCFRVQ